MEAVADWFILLKCTSNFLKENWFAWLVFCSLFPRKEVQTCLAQGRVCTEPCSMIKAISLFLFLCLHSDFFFPTEKEYILT